MWIYKDKVMDKYGYVRIHGYPKKNIKQDIHGISNFIHVDLHISMYPNISKHGYLVLISCEYILTDFHEISMTYPCGSHISIYIVSYPRYLVWISCMDMFLITGQHQICKYVNMSWTIIGKDWIYMYIIGSIYWISLDLCVWISHVYRQISMDIWHQFLDCRCPIPM